MKTLSFTVSNNLVYDQRMIRICNTLAVAGYNVQLIGVHHPGSPELQPAPFDQHRIPCFFRRGFAFYAEFNLKLFSYLLFSRSHLVCAIDLDTILPCYFASKLKGIRRVYDAHELFCEMKEVVTRPWIHRFWKTIERWMVPKFRFGYTVSQPIADIFYREYQVAYNVIRNVPVKFRLPEGLKREKILLYQGAVNEGRCFETLIPAMQWVDAPLHIYGDGNFLTQTRDLIRKYGLEDKVILKGKRSPEELKMITATAWAGITLFENTGLSNYYSLANRYFDYIQAGTPQLCVNFPAYREINQQHEVALLIDDPSLENIAAGLNNLLQNEVLYKELHIQCTIAAVKFNWQLEEKKLTELYQQILA